MLRAPLDHLVDHARRYQPAEFCPILVGGVRGLAQPSVLERFLSDPAIAAECRAQGNTLVIDGDQPTPLLHAIAEKFYSSDPIKKKTEEEPCFLGNSWVEPEDRGQLTASYPRVLRKLLGLPSHVVQGFYLHQDKKDLMVTLGVRHHKTIGQQLDFSFGGGLHIDRSVAHNLEDEIREENELELTSFRNQPKFLDTLHTARGYDKCFFQGRHQICTLEKTLKNGQRAVPKPDGEIIDYQVMPLREIMHTIATVKDLDGYKYDCLMGLAVVGYTYSDQANAHRRQLGEKLFTRPASIGTAPLPAGFSLRPVPEIQQRHFQKNA